MFYFITDYEQFDGYDSYEKASGIFLNEETE